MIRVDTWKQVTEFDVTSRWSNTYYLSQDLLDEMQHTYDGGDKMRGFLLNERNLHLNTVLYKVVTAYSIDGDITNGMIMWTWEGGLTGFWDHPTGIAPWHTVVRTTMSAPTGRPRQFYWRRCLQNSDIATTDSGHILFPAIGKFGNIWRDTVGGWFGIYPQADFFLRRSIYRPTEATWVNPVKWQVRGVSELRAQERAAARYAGNGTSLFEATLDIVYRIAAYRRDWWLGRDLHLDQWHVYSYFIPLVTLLADSISLCQQVSDFFGSSSGGGGGQGNIARWPPHSDAISDIAKSLKDTLQGQLDAMDNITWNGAGTDLWCSDSDADHFKDASLTLSKTMAWIPSCDFRTPLNEHS